MLRPLCAEGGEFVFAQKLPRHAEENLLLLLEMSAADFDHLRGEGASLLQLRGGLDAPEQVCDLVVFHPHDRERSALRAEMRFQRGEEQFILEARVGLERERKRGKFVLQGGS